MTESSCELQNTCSGSSDITAKKLIMIEAFNKFKHVFIVLNSHMEHFFQFMYSNHILSVSPDDFTIKSLGKVAAINFAVQNNLSKCFAHQIIQHKKLHLPIFLSSI